jgi:hypothetical protein
MRAERIKQNVVDARTVRVPPRAPQWIIPAVKALLVITDLIIAAGSFLLAFYFRQGAAIFETTGGFHWTREFAPYAG